ncbi:MAG: hypothetical protein MHMPM18_000206 [Marteilia pararefringens]
MNQCLLFMAVMTSNILASRIALETGYTRHSTTCDNEYSMQFSLFGADYKVRLIDDSERKQRIVKIDPEDEKVRFFNLVSAQYWDPLCVGAESGKSTPFYLNIHPKRNFLTRNGNYISKKDLSKIPDDGEVKDVRILVPKKGILYNTDPEISEIYDPELERFVHELSGSPKDHVQWKCNDDLKTVLILIIYDDHVARMYTRIDFTDPANPKTHGARIMMRDAADTIRYTDFCSVIDKKPISANANLLKVFNNNDLENGKFCSTIPSGFMVYASLPKFSDRYDYQSVSDFQISKKEYIIGFRLPNLDVNNCVDITRPTFLNSMYTMPVATNKSGDEKNNNKTAIIVGASCGGIVAIIGIMFVIYMRTNKSYGEKLGNNAESAGLEPNNQNYYGNPNDKIKSHKFDRAIIDKDQQINGDHRDNNNPNAYEDPNDYANPDV